MPRMSVSDFVKDSKLPTKLDLELTTHTFLESTSVTGRRGRRREREEVWKKKRHLGIGTFGTVWLEECISEDKLRAVKEVRKPAPGSRALDYNRELEAIARFSQQKVGFIPWNHAFAPSFSYHD
jgi:serine/threonine protein kinase